MTDKPFPELPGGYPFPRLEREVLDFWRRQRIFEKTLERTRHGEPFVFFEGPPTANNAPHVGHVLTRVVKDLFPRFKTMQGRHVARKAGWDTHGLPVEIEVEKRLGLSGKKDIEQIVPGDPRASIEAFNRTCLDSVMTYEKQWREMTERVGYWVDLDDAYFTYTNEYIESVWWALGQLFDQDLLFEGFKIQPYCARCGTTLSSHEVAQNYKETEDPSIWTIFRLRPGAAAKDLGGETVDLGGAGLVGWTTTPWTTLANAAVAVHPDLRYKLIEHPGRPGERLVIGERLEVAVPLLVERDGKRQPIDLRQAPALALFPGRQLEGLAYQRLFEFFEPGTDGRVVLGDYVTSTDGTGLVHTAPPFGEDDYQTGRRYGLPMILAVTGEGKIAEGAGEFSGLWFKDADVKIQQDLRRRELLLHSERHKHNYPFCWRCDQPLLYFASRSWFVKTTAIRDRLVEHNRRIGWHPEHIGQGRFGNWLEGVVDWALSRKRYWGTPLPLWRCDSCAAVEAVASFAELFRKSGQPLPASLYDRAEFDPHRPYLDEVGWSCGHCEQGRMRRVDDVIDAWFDSGAMPFAQHHYPFDPAKKDRVTPGGAFRPADFISEAVDQTRGWFYTLHVLACALFDQAAFRNCIVMGHVNDEQGRKMSKRLGNVVDPMKVIEETGADALRWYFYLSDPEQPSRFSARLVREAAQNFLIPLWNAVSFFTIYANIDGWRPGQRAPLAEEKRPFLDRWVLGRLRNTTNGVTERLEGYQIAGSAKLLEDFVADLTNWYIRRSRDRFWAGAESDDKESAYQTLYAILATLPRLIAPFMPFVAEVLHRHLVRSLDAGAPESVHLAPWPPRVDDEGHAETIVMKGVQRIVALGRTSRGAHNIKTRQPLARAFVVTRSEAEREELERELAGHLDLIRDELNVKEIVFAANRSEFVRFEVRPNFRVLGKRIGGQMKAVQAALQAADGDTLAAELERFGFVELSLGGDRGRVGEQGDNVQLSEADLEVRLIEREGTATANDGELLVALDTALTPALIDEGRAREIVSRIQAERKEQDLDYTDRIRVHYRAAPEIEQALAAHREHVQGETLAVEIAPAGDRGGLKDAPIDELDFAFSIERAG